jgi:hypothetical protein
LSQRRLRGGNCLLQREKGKSRSTDVEGHNAGAGVAASKNRATALNSRRLAAQKIAETAIWAPKRSREIQQNQDHKESFGEKWPH